MVNIRITLSGVWVALMLTYLLGDVMRIFAGDFTAGKMGGETATQWMWLAAALLMLIPIVMVVLTLTIPYPAIRWIGIVAAGFLFIFNAVGLPTYPGHYDKLLIVVGLAFNVLTIWLSATWRTPA
ncbi:DUF6326 family protein [Candidatus Bipolaricaulota bacterium]